MRSKLLLTAALAAAAAVGAGSAASAGPTIINGDFSASNYGSSSQFGVCSSVYLTCTQGVTGWQGDFGLTEWFTAPGQEAANQWNDPLDYFTTSGPNAVSASPGGGAFLAIDGDPSDPGQVSTTVTGLTVGNTYTLTFDWAAAQFENRNAAYQVDLEAIIMGTGAATSSTTPLEVEGQHAFSGWMNGSLTFTATDEIETLSFLATGSPSGEPPVALLDDVSFSVPEPATWAMMILGFGAIGVAMRRRNHAFAAA